MPLYVIPWRVMYIIKVGKEKVIFNMYLLHKSV